MSVVAIEKMYPVSVAFEMLIGAKPASQTISRLVKTGHLRAFKVLGEWHCRIQDVVDHMEANTTRHLAMERPKAGVKTRSEAKRARDIAVANATLEQSGVK